MSKTKNILLASTIGLMGISLFACSSKETRNTQIPYDNISASTTVAKVGNITVTQQELYDQLKYKNGYRVFTEELDRMLYGDELSKVEYSGDVKIEVDEAIATAVYGTSELSKLKLMPKKDLELARKKFVDSMKLNGLEIKEEELVFDTITKQTKNVSFSHLSKSTIDHYKVPQAKKSRGKKYINDVCDKEFIEKANGKFKKNEYYISEKQIEAQYESNYRHHNTAKGIILRYNNASDALNAISEATNGAGLTTANAVDSYVKLFNDYYNYFDKEKKLTVDTIGTNEETIFETNEELVQLDIFSPNVKKLFIEDMTNGEALLKPLNIDDKYYLIYRADVEYKTGLSKDLSFSQLEKELPNKFEDIKKELKDDIIDSKASSVSSTLYSEDLEKSGIMIYDPYIENTFAGSNTFYEYVTDFNSKYIFTTKDNKYSLTTEQFYNKLLNYEVEATVVDIVLDKYLNKEHSSYITEEEKKTITDDLNTELKEFKKGNKNLNKDYGEENYLYFQYGHTSKQAVLDSKFADIIKQDKVKDFIKTNWASGNTPNDAELQLLNKLVDSSLEVLKDKKLFDINLDHILISIDNNQDGNPDNMLEFLDSLSAEEKVKFEQAITDLTKAITNEVQNINRENTKEKLDYIVKAFNNNYPTYDGKNWSEYKTYHFVLKAETLGNVDENSVNNFVTEFKDYVEELFDTAVRNDLKVDTSNKEYEEIRFPDRKGSDGKFEKVEYKNFTADDLCATQFGYHMISINSYKKDSTTLNFKFTKEQDTSHDYGKIKLILDEKDKDNKDDDIFLYTDIYNTESDRPSLHQVLVYYVEKTNGDVTSIKTNIKNNLSTLLDEVISKYQSYNFQEYLLLLEMGEITSDNIPNFDYKGYLDYKKNSNEAYDNESYFYQNWYNKDFWN